MANKKYVAINHKVEVNGQTVLSVVNGLGSMGMRNTAVAVLSDCGIKNITSDNWYPQQNWLDAFTEISEKFGHYTLYEIGLTIPENAKFPEGIENVHDALGSVDVAYHINHRIDGNLLLNNETGEKKEGIGNYHYKIIDNKKGEMVCDNPYPCSFDRGIIYAIANKFKPSGVVVNIYHDEESSCREKGDNSCSYLVSW